MKAVLALTLLALSTSAFAQTTPSAQVEAGKVIAQLSEIEANRQNYEIQTYQYTPVGDFLLHECVTAARGLQLFLRDAKSTEANTFLQSSPYDSTLLRVIPAHNETFDNLKEKFKGVESGFDFKRTSPGDSDSGELTLGEVSMRMWQAPNQKTRVYLHCLKDYAPSNGYQD